MTVFADSSGRKYRVVLSPMSEEDGGGWIARIPELPGCMSAADSMDEALEMLQEAKEAWICAAQNTGQSVPEAIPADHEYSGKFTLRIPRSLHRQLAIQAEAEGVSLNQYCTHMLSSRTADASLQAQVERAFETTILAQVERAFEAARLAEALRVFDEPTWLWQEMTEQGGDYGKIEVVASDD